MKTRTILVMLWLCFFSLNEFTLFYTRARGWIELDSLKSALTQLTALYAPYVGAISAFYLAGRRQNTSGNRFFRMQFMLATFASLFWNLGVTFFMIPLLFGRGGIDSAIDGCSDFASIAAWLVAPAMGFYFAQKSET